jgi:hypothetical protein
MTPEERNDLIATYAAGYDEVMNALDGFPADSLGAHPIPGKWSAREIVHHLGDSESFSRGDYENFSSKTMPSFRVTTRTSSPRSFVTTSATWRRRSKLSLRA